MARKKKMENTVTSFIGNINSELKGKFRLSESYVSLILGMLIVVFAVVLAFGFITNRNTNNTLTTGVSSAKTEITENNVKNVQELPFTYIVAAGDNLWLISEKIYKSGYNWADIANANKLDNPGIIEVGEKLIIPKVEAKLLTLKTENVQNSNTKSVNNQKNNGADKELTSVSNSISGSSYTVKSGDYLWDIAVRAYGDGYQWVKIAQVNKLTNPDFVFSGDVLKIPR